MYQVELVCGPLDGIIFTVHDPAEPIFVKLSGLWHEWHCRPLHEVGTSYKADYVGWLGPFVESN